MFCLLSNERFLIDTSLMLSAKINGSGCAVAATDEFIKLLLILWSMRLDAESVVEVLSATLAKPILAFHDSSTQAQHLAAFVHISNLSTRDVLVNHDVIICNKDIPSASITDKFCVIHA